MRALLARAVLLMAVVAPRTAWADAASLTVAGCDEPGLSEVRSGAQHAVGARLDDRVSATVLCIGLVVDVRLVRAQDSRLFSRVLDLRRIPMRSRARTVVAALSSLVEAAAPPTPAPVAAAVPSEPLPAEVPREVPGRSEPPAPRVAVAAAGPPEGFTLGVDAGLRFLFGSTNATYGGAGLTIGAVRGTLEWLAGARFELGNNGGVLLGTHATGALRVRIDRGVFALAFGLGIRAGWLGLVDPSLGPGSVIAAPSLSGALSLRVNARVALSLQFEQGLDLPLRSAFAVTPWLAAGSALLVSIP